MRRPTIRVSGPTLDSANPSLLAKFYERLLGWPIVRQEGPRPGQPSDDGWAMLRSPTGDLKIEVQWEPHFRRPVWPSAEGEQLMMVHLDVGVDDLDAGVEWSLRHGATLAADQPQDDVRVLLDPDGHPFCMFRDDSRSDSSDGSILDETTVVLHDAQIEASSWVYAWLADDERGRSQVFYVGATGLPPAVRAWLHVNDDDPDIGRVRAQHPELLNGDVKVRAFRIREDLDRQLVKVRVQQLLAESNATDRESTAEDVCASRIVEALDEEPDR